MSEIVNAFGALVVTFGILILLGYGLCRITGGPKAANSYLRFLGRITTAIGRQVGVFCRRYPLPAGIIVLVIIFALAIR